MTPKEAREIRRRSAGLSAVCRAPHPLDGYSVREFVGMCRTGKFLKAPRTTDIAKLSAKIADEWDDVTFEEIA